jgi:tRNA threonylcarbamoyladenosine biosynthesis protein TsaE
MGSDALVTSPTFTIGKQYPAGRLTVYHFDFYRLQEPGLVVEELQEALNDSTAVIVIEWAETVRDVLPAHRIRIEIMKTAEDENQRNLFMSVPPELSHIVGRVAS